MNDVFVFCDLLSSGNSQSLSVVFLHTFSRWLHSILFIGFFHSCSSYGLDSYCCVANAISWMNHLLPLLINSHNSRFSHLLLYIGLMVFSSIMFFSSMFEVGCDNCFFINAIYKNHFHPSYFCYFN